MASTEAAVANWLVPRAPNLLLPNRADIMPPHSRHRNITHHHSIYSIFSLTSQSQKCSTKSIILRPFFAGPGCVVRWSVGGGACHNALPPPWPRPRGSNLLIAEVALTPTPPSPISHLTKCVIPSHSSSILCQAQHHYHISI